MIKIYTKNAKQKTLELAKELKKGTWIYVENPTLEEIAQLSAELSLEEGHLRDALDVHEVPRLERENGTTYIFTRFAYTDNNQIETSPILIILSKHEVLTLSRHSFTRLERLIAQPKNFTTTGSKILIITAILSQIIMTYNDYLNSISKEVRSYTHNLEKVKNRDIIQFLMYENVLNDFNLALIRSNAIVQSFLPGKIIELDNNEHDQLEDLSLYMGQLIQISNENLRTIINLREAYSTIITNNLNQIIKLFTSLTVILTVPTIISSFYGMNVNLPFAAHPFAFFNIFSLTFIIVIGAIIIFKKKDWI